LEEKKAINAVEEARDRVIGSIQKDKLFAIYIKGSFARREMKEGSDVDMVPIVTENKYEGAVFGVNSPQINPVVVVPLSLWEFKHNKLWTKSSIKPDLRARPDRFLKKLKDCKLIYGRSLNPKDYPIRSDREALIDEIKLIQSGYIPAYKNGKITFDPLLKEVFWLVELEQSVAGNKVKHSFEGIAKSVGDMNHIVHEAINLRKIKDRSKAQERSFIVKLEEHLKRLK
jgi:hypothetical protein